jgi:sodium/potassium/calcium exchanger 6
MNASSFSTTVVSCNVGTEDNTVVENSVKITSRGSMALDGKYQSSKKRRQSSSSSRTMANLSLLLSGITVSALAIVSLLNYGIAGTGTTVLLSRSLLGNDYLASPPFSSYSCSDFYANTLNSTQEEQCAYAQQCDGEGMAFAFVFCSSQKSAVTYSLLISPLVLLWLVTLFRVLGSTAEDFFSPALEMLSMKMGLPPRFAGVSLLALGNGAADVSSTMSAIASDPNHGYLLSLGALTGSGMFISTVVAGIVIVVADGQIPCRGALVRDVLVFMTAVSLIWASFALGSIGPVQIYSWIALYLSFLITVLAADIYHRKVVLPQLEALRQQKLKKQQLLQQQIPPYIPQNSSEEPKENTEMELALMDGKRHENLIKIHSVSNLAEVIEEEVPILRYSRFGRILETLSNYNYKKDMLSSDDQGWGFDSKSSRPVLFHAKYGLVKKNGSSESEELEGMYNEISPSKSSSHEITSTISYQPMSDMDDNFQVEYTNDTYTEEDEGGIHRGGTYAQSWYQAWEDGNKEFITHWYQFWEDIYWNDENSIIDKVLLTCEMPFTILRQLTIPVPCDGYYCRPLLAISVALSTLWVGLYYWICYSHNILFPQIILVAFPLSLIAGLMILRFAPYDERDLSLYLTVPISLYGFVIAATWINFIADKLVGVLGYLGVICHIPG